MLIGNGKLYNKVPLTLLGDMWNTFVRDERVSARCFDGFGDKSAMPSGYGVGRAIWPAITAGGLNSHRYSKGDSTATISMQSGINIVGLAEGTTPTSEATLQLVVSMLGAIAGTSTAEGNILAALGMAGSSAGTSTVSALINALAWAIGQADGESTATLVSYAQGELKGSISPFAELSPEGLAAAVWNSLVANYQEDGSMGKALGAASVGGVDLELLAAAVLAAAQASPIHADTRKVVGITVTGTGTESDPWGP